MGKTPDMPGAAGKKKPEDRKVSSRNLRAEAEKKVARSAVKTSTLKKRDLDKLIHELEVNQVEFEMQNDKLLRSQAELEAARERYFELYDLAPVGYFSISQKGIILEANLTGANMLGVVPRDLRAQRFSSFIYKEDQDTYYLHRQQLFETRAPRACGIRMVRKDGSLIWALIEATIAKDAKSGKPVCLATVSDVTGQKELEDLLRNERDRAQGYLDTVETIIVALNREGKITSINRKGCQLFGCSEVDLLGQNWFSSCLPQPDGMKEVYPFFLKLISGELEAAEYFENAIVTRSGEIRHIAWHNALLRDNQGQIIGTLSSGDDITEIKKTHQELLASEEKFRNIFDNSAIGKSITSIDGRMSINQALADMLGYEKEELSRVKWQHITHPDDVAETDMHIEPLRAGREKSARFIKRYIKKDGSIVWADVNTVLQRDVDGQPLYYITAVMDITERKLAERRIRESEHQYRLLADHTTDFIWLMDMDLKPVYQSPSAEKLTGFTQEELTELPFERRVTPVSLKLASEIFLDELPRVLTEPDYNPIHIIDLEIYRKDGTTLWSENKFSIIRDEDGRPISILGEARDITQRKLTEEKLEKSYEAIKKALDDAINTMVKIVELRDPYTAGHQHKVADLATAIARKMELDDTIVDQLRTAALIHDIGKMYVPSDILSKPGKLSEIELGLIKTHSKSGYDIVKSMDFPGVVALVVLQHHERLDGSGYPNQLKAEDTLLEAKILAVADVVEAMASHRPYRPAMGIDKALGELSNGRGKLYDPDVVDTCTELFNSGNFAFKSV